jgi:hypothetical protein
MELMVATENYLNTRIHRPSFHKPSSLFARPRFQNLTQLVEVTANRCRGERCKSSQISPGRHLEHERPEPIAAAAELFSAPVGAEAPCLPAAGHQQCQPGRQGEPAGPPACRGLPRHSVAAAPALRQQLLRHHLPVLPSACGASAWCMCSVPTVSSFCGARAITNRAAEPSTTA